MIYKSVPLFSILMLLSFFFGVRDLYGQQYLQMIEDGGYRFEEVQTAAEKYFNGRDKGRGSGYKQWKRWEYDAQRTLDDDGYVIDDFSRYQLLKEYNNILNNQYRSNELDCMGDWHSEGPYSVSGRAAYDPGIGRIAAVAVDPNNDMHMLAGAETGGVWKTTDGGKTWHSLSDELNTLKVSSLAIDPTNSEIYYWGISQGLIFKSINGGSTWLELNYDKWGSVEKIVVNPNNPLELWLADAGFGVFHSADGGITWNQLLEDRCFDIEMHPTDTSILYASGNRIWKSEDGGITWSQLNFTFSVDRPIFIDVSEAAPENLYVLQSAGRNFEGLYISRDEGSSFVRLYEGNKNLLGYDQLGRDPGGQAPRNMDIAISDIDSNYIFVAGINLWRSTDGGKDFSAVTYFGYNHQFDTMAYCHADIECLEVVNNQLYLGTDGGLYLMPEMMSDTISTGSIVDLSEGLDIRQIYKLGLAKESGDVMSVGAQDNGTAFRMNSEWRHYGGGDGTGTFVVEQPDRLMLFGSSQYGALYVSNDTGRSTSPLTGTYALHGSGKWITPFEHDPNDDMTIYAGFDRVYKSEDLGATSHAISQDFHPSFIEIASTGSDTMYAASANNVYRTTDGGTTTWDRVLYNNVNTGTVTDVAIHPRNANLVAVATSSSTQVWLTRDGGENWEEWDQGIFFSALSLVWENNDMESIYAGSTTGVVHRDKNSDGWAPFDHGLPRVKVNELEIHEESGYLYAATYGRGVWKSPLCEEIMSSTKESDDDIRIDLSPNPVQAGAAIKISWNSSSDSDIQIFNIQGQLILQQKNISPVAKTIKVIAPNIPGIYFIRIESKENLKVKRIVVE